MTDWGRETCGDLAAAESREWLCTNGLGGFASGTVAGLLSRRYHGLLVAALRPPLGRTLVVAKVDETLIDDGVAWPLFTNRWADGSINPHGYRHIERFRLDGTIPTWTYACGDVLVEKRVWMEHGANTTYVRYAALRASRPLTLELRALANYRDYHALTRGSGWRMRVAPFSGGLRVDAFEGAAPVFLLAAGAEASAAHTWHESFRLAREGERGLDDREDHLHAGTFRARLEAGRPLTLVLSTEANAAIDGEQALARRRQHDASVVATWHAATATAATAPAWVERVLAGTTAAVVSLGITAAVMLAARGGGSRPIDNVDYADATTVGEQALGSEPIDVEFDPLSFPASTSPTGGLFTLPDSSSGTPDAAAPAAPSASASAPASSPAADVPRNQPLPATNPPSEPASPPDATPPPSTPPVVLPPAPPIPVVDDVVGTLDPVLDTLCGSLPVCSSPDELTTLPQIPGL